MTESTKVTVAQRPAAPARAHYPFGFIQREIDRLFDEVGHAAWPPLLGGGAAVSMDFAETDKGIELTAELPGMEEKDVKVTLTGRTLTISGEKQVSKEEKDKSYRFVERSFGAFSRSIDLPPDVEADKINASLANGVLKVTAPRAARPAPKQIEVTHAA